MLMTVVRGVWLFLHKYVAKVAKSATQKTQKRTKKLKKHEKRRTNLHNCSGSRSRPDRRDPE
jgi:hypothetical protein